MPNIASIGGVLIANIANFGGNANFASVGGIDTPPVFGLLYVSGFYVWIDDNWVDPGAVGIPFQGFVGGFPVWSCPPVIGHQMFNSTGNWWEFYYDSNYAFEGGFGDSVDDPTGVTSWTYQSGFVDNGFNCYFTPPS